MLRNTIPEVCYIWSFGSVANWVDIAFAIGLRCDLVLTTDETATGDEFGCSKDRF